jgi:hypothetical protein
MNDGQMISKNTQAMCDAKPLGVLEQLQVKRGHLLQKIAEVDKTIEVFTKHPEFEQCLTQLSRVGIYR